MVGVQFFPQVYCAGSIGEAKNIANVVAVIRNSIATTEISRLRM